MTNFFVNLAARVVDNENAVRPRVAARFEASEPVAELAEINEEIASGVDAEIVPGSPQRHRDSGPSGVNAVAESRGQVAPKRSSAPSDSAQPIDPDPADALPANTPSRREVKRARGPESHTTVAPATPHHVHDADDVPLPQQDKAIVVKTDVPVQDRAVVARLSTQGHITQPAAAGRAIAPIATAAASRRPTTVNPPRETHVAPNTRERPGPAGALPSPETVVHVTIGRVELRAPPTAEPRKREQPSQTGTLAEYLQKHAAARTRS